MKPQTYQEIPLTLLKPSPYNPRKNFEGKQFDDLVASVRQQGVLEPILVRRLNENGPFEIVAGERRFRALSLIAGENGGLDAHTIPSIVKDLTDDEAFDVMTIENLVRADLSELEEAEGFKAYLDKKGDGALPDLAQRTGIDARYIRRRVAVMALPKKVLKLWEAGALKYGHLEQLMRIPDSQHRKLIIKGILQWGRSVKFVKQQIDEHAVNFSVALFDRNDCGQCGKNSQVQHQLFDLGESKNAFCYDPACFKKKQAAWLEINWAASECGQKQKTNGFRFCDDLGWDDWQSIDGRVQKECKQCNYFVSLILLSGAAVYERACIGDKSCFKKTMQAKNKKQQAVSGSGCADDPAPSSAHGAEFLDKFLLERIPAVVDDLEDMSDKALHLTLFSVLKSNHDACQIWARVQGLIGEHDCFYSADEIMLKRILTLDLDEVLVCLKGVALAVVMQGDMGGYNRISRRMIAEHLGVDIQKEWRLTEDYLKKKTIKQLLQLGEKFNVFEQKAAKDFLFEVLMKKRGTFTSCKKGELIRVFLESGIDLAGMVPDEILEG